MTYQELVVANIYSIQREAKEFEKDPHAPV